MEKKDKPKLGKGLNQIFGGNVQQVIDNIKESRTNGIIDEVNITKLVVNPFQPRKQFDVKEIEGLAQSIKENGLFTPILVKENEDGDYFIVAGERRVRAAKLAGLETVKAVIANVSNTEMQRIALVENIQREDLNPIEVAKSLKEMIEKQELKQDEVAIIIGKSRSYVANLLGLLKLDKKIINGVLNGKISYGHARTLISLNNNSAKNLYVKIILQNLSVRETENYTKIEKLKKYGVNKKLIKLEKKSQEILYAEELVRNKLKSKVEITSNEIKIKYRGKEQLSKILERMEAIEK